MADAPSLPTLLVFADDWGRSPSSSQHLMRQLLDRYRVLWVNTIGMRPPRFNLSTLRRGLENPNSMGILSSQRLSLVCSPRPHRSST